MVPQVIDRFTGDFDFLSNFSPSEVELNGVKFPTVEHAYQAAKCSQIADFNAIRSCSTPGKAKRVGKLVKLRHDWEEVKVQTMAALLVQKFTRGSELAKKLEETETAVLVEGNTWNDTFWGVCGGFGMNVLGKLLMEIRDSLQFPNKGIIENDEQKEQE